MQIKIVTIAFVLLLANQTFGDSGATEEECLKGSDLWMQALASLAMKDHYNKCANVRESLDALITFTGKNCIGIGKVQKNNETSYTFHRQADEVDSSEVCELYKFAVHVFYETLIGDLQNYKEILDKNGSGEDINDAISNILKTWKSIREFESSAKKFCKDEIITQKIERCQLGTITHVLQILNSCSGCSFEERTSKM